jgi:hypothetical protein
MTTEREADARQHQCPHCGVWFVVNTLLRRHLTDYHNEG